MIIAIIQAREGSTRYPDKMIKARIGKGPILQEIRDRLSQCKVDETVVAIPFQDNNLFRLCKILNMQPIRSKYLRPEDVLGRFVYVCDKKKLDDTDWVLRVCGDAPFVEPIFVNQCINETASLPECYDAVINTKLPVGQWVELFRVGTLRKVYNKVRGKGHYHRTMEHIDPILKWSTIRKFTVTNLNLSIDTKEDEAILNRLIK